MVLALTYTLEYIAIIGKLHNDAKNKKVGLWFMS